MSDAYVCINCGAALTFDSETSQSAACSFCNVINAKAQLELQKERAEKRRIELAAADRRRFAMQVAGIVCASVLVIAGIGFTRTSGEVASSWAEVERARAQLKNVHERQQAVEAQWKDSPASEARDAELSGAENRVRVERRNYDQAASVYNAAVGTWWSSVVARVKSLPARADPSTEAW